MGLINVKCENCGANVKVNSRTGAGICQYCGTHHFATDKAGASTQDMQAVLEKLLIEYFLNDLNDEEYIRKYALRVQEHDIDNPLAHYVAFDDIDDPQCIMQLLFDAKTNISLPLFIALSCMCSEYLRPKWFVEHIAKYKTDTNGKDIIMDMINYTFDREASDFMLIYHTMHSMKLSADDNNELLETLYVHRETDKYIMLSQLKAFSHSCQDFEYDKEKYDQYLAEVNAHRKRLRELEEMANAQRRAEKENEKKKEKIPEWLRVTLITMLALASSFILYGIIVAFI